MTDEGDIKTILDVKEDEEGLKSIRSLIANSIKNNSIAPYYPLPSNEGYEKFLQTQKKETYKRTQYSIHFLLSQRDKHTEKPTNMKDIKLPIKNEIRSRAKILTDEAFRETRNYIKGNNYEFKYKDNLEKYIDLSKKRSTDNHESNLGELLAKTNDLREILNKISKESYDEYLKDLLKYEYDYSLLDNFKNLLFSKIVTERSLREIYFKICFEMIDLYHTNSKISDNSNNNSNIKQHNKHKKTVNKIENNCNVNLDFKELMIKRCKEELFSDESQINFPYNLDNDEKASFLKEVKYGSVKLISEFYNKNIVDEIIINEIIDYLLEKENDLSIKMLCELIKKICLKYYKENMNKLDEVANTLEKLYCSQFIDTKTKFFILDCLDLKKISWGVKGSHFRINKNKGGGNNKETSIVITNAINTTNNTTNNTDNTIIDNTANIANTTLLNINALFSYDNLIKLPNNTNNSNKRASIDISSRKGSINPTQVDYLRRSRFNSRADELKSSKENDIDLMNELVSNLGADIQFYQSFKLDKEDFNIISKDTEHFIKEWKENRSKFSIQEQQFNKMIDDVPCEKFIAVGHMIEVMFSKSREDADCVKDICLYFYENDILNGDDIKHGIVLGLVNFRDNMIDYPNSKIYLKEFLTAITDKGIIDQKLKKVYEDCCNNIEKFLF